MKLFNFYAVLSQIIIEILQASTISNPDQVVL